MKTVEGGYNIPAVVKVVSEQIWAANFASSPTAWSRMKRAQLIKHLNNHGAYWAREGSKHSIFQRGDLKTQVPRHGEIVDQLARKICKDLDIPFVR